MAKTKLSPAAIHRKSTIGRQLTMRRFYVCDLHRAGGFEGYLEVCADDYDAAMVLCKERSGEYEIRNLRFLREAML